MHRIGWSHHHFAKRWGYSDIRIVFGPIVEHRITTHRHEYFTFRGVSLIYIYRVTDTTERIVILTAGIGRHFTPQRIRDILIGYICAILIRTLTIPTPPAEEMNFTNRQLHILIRIIIQNTFVFVYLLHTVFDGVTGSTLAVNKVLVIRIGEITRLCDRHTVINKAHYGWCLIIIIIIDHQDIRQIDICRTR